MRPLRAEWGSAPSPRYNNQGGAMSQINPRSNPASAPATAAEMAAVLEQTRELAIARLTEAVRTVLAVADDALFDFMQKSGGNSNQPHFLDAMRELRRRRGEIEVDRQRGV